MNGLSNEQDERDVTLPPEQSKGQDVAVGTLQEGSTLPSERMGEVIVFCTLLLLGGGLFAVVAFADAHWYPPAILYAAIVFFAWQRFFAPNDENAAIAQVSLRAAKLENADLAGAQLPGVDLSDAKLQHANLTKVNLSGANLTNADLSYAQLGKATLVGADLSKSTLIGVHLSGAFLRDAYLAHAKLKDAVLEESDLTGAVVTKQQLDEVKSLRGATMPDGTKHD